MPVEIKKIVVKAVVSNQSKDDLRSSALGVNNNSNKLDELEKRLIVEESVQQVLAILERQKVR